MSTLLCCCKIDRNRMIEPCAFHAAWRDKAIYDSLAEKEKELAELREKVRVVTDTWKDYVVSSCSIGLQPHTKAIAALRAAVEK